MSDRTIGTCSQCGGPVVIPGVWLGVIPPVPQCRNCGATAKPAYGKVIETEPIKRDAMLAARKEAEGE